MDFPRPIKLWEWLQDPHGYEGETIGGTWLDHLGRPMNDDVAKEISYLA